MNSEGNLGDFRGRISYLNSNVKVFSRTFETTPRNLANLL